MGSLDTPERWLETPDFTNFVSAHFVANRHTVNSAKIPSPPLALEIALPQSLCKIYDHTYYVRVVTNSNLKRDSFVVFESLVCSAPARTKTTLGIFQLWCNCLEASCFTALGIRFSREAKENDMGVLPGNKVT